MPDEEITQKEPEILEGLSSPPQPDEWIPLIDASEILGLKSIRQVYRRIKKHGIQHRRVATGTRVRSYVRREDVLKSKKLAWEEAQISDMSEETSDMTSARRQANVGLEVARDVIPQIKDFISSTSNKLEKIEVVRGLVADLLDLARDDKEERQQERKATLRAKEQERRTNLVKLICYLVVSLFFCGFVGYMTWKIYTGEFFLW